MPERPCTVFEKGDLILEGKYRVERCLGRGGFAEVYLVTHVALNAPRAVKVLHRQAPGVGSTQMHLYRERFTLEAQLGARLDHPHIIRVYDFIAEGEEALYLVMEYAPGGSLYQRLEEVRDGKRPPLSVDEVVRLGLDVATGLAALHQRQIVHRDLKPSNILFDAEGRAKVADLGLAQVPGGPSMRSRLSEPEPHPGTPAYMSPEQESTLHLLTPVSDLYALGLILAEALTGQLWKSYLNQHPAARVRDLRDDMPAWLDDLIQWLLAPAINDRPQTVEQVMEVLLAYEDTGTAKIGSPRPRQKKAPGVQITTPSRKGEKATIRLHPGHPHYPTLADAVTALSPGGTLYLAPGVYHLKKTLVINKPLVLIGEDRDMTVVGYRGDGDVVRYTGTGVFKAQNITFRHLGGSWGNVVVVENGLVEFENCRFTGGTLLEKDDEDLGGTGILFRKRAWGGKVIRCICDNNELHGIEVDDDAAPMLSKNMCYRNGGSGILYSGRSGGIAQENRCIMNGFHGIEIQFKSRPSLISNTCEENNECGIAYWDESGGVARDNICNNNEDGILVGEQSAPALIKNICNRNMQNGIVYYDESAGEARENVCSENGYHGVSVNNEAAPILKRNACEKNGKSNLYVAPTAKPVLTENTC